MKQTQQALVLLSVDIAETQGYINTETYQKFSEKAESIAKQLYGFNRKLKTKD